MDENLIQNVNVDDITEQEVKTFTQEEVVEMIQKETDRRVTSALQKQQKKFEKQLSLSQMDEEAREKAMKDDKIAELEAKLSEYNRMKARNEVTKVLSNRNLDARFADMIDIGEDEKEALAKIESLDKLFKEAVKREVEKRIGTTTPKASNISTQGITEEQFNKLTIRQQSELLKSNPELVNSFLR